MGKYWTITCYLGAYRRAKGWSQKQLAAQLGVSRVTVAGWEAGRRLPSLDVALVIAQLLGCPIGDIWVIAQKPPGIPPEPS